MHALFTGVGTALVTPFAADDSIDFETLGRLIERQIASEIPALVACGTTGEPATMTEAEQDELIGFTVERAAGRALVIAGVGGNDTKRVCRRAQTARNLGADAILAVTPYYNKTTQAGLIEHFTRVADAAEIPVVLYNVPSRTGLNLLPETAMRLAGHPMIVALKEANPDLRQMTEGARLLAGKMAVYSGNDEHAFSALALGADGVISVASNLVPEAVKAVTDRFFSGDIDESRALQLQLNPLIDALFLEVSPIPVKEALAAIGFGNGKTRPPLVPMDDMNREKLLVELHRWFPDARRLALAALADRI
jgi:4-hydroxy-tetrahydrodipicolinate synthase